MATMTHTPAQRKAWHSGKKRPREDVYSWYRRVYIKAGNLRGAYTNPRLKRGIFYQALNYAR